MCITSTRKAGKFIIYDNMSLRVISCTGLDKLLVKIRKFNGTVLTESDAVLYDGASFPSECSRRRKDSWIVEYKGPCQIHFYTQTRSRTCKSDQNPAFAATVKVCTNCDAIYCSSCSTNKDICERNSRSLGPQPLKITVEFVFDLEARIKS
ncbi:hypothetical protein HK102_001660 [Quaeritorhiza haematococci]|nr:hypothetical protein HK102_001660 [Quaeritorhiza haematococci]